MPGKKLNSPLIIIEMIEHVDITNTWIRSYKG